MTTFNEAVLGWLLEQGKDAAEVIKVKGEGSDWEGSTEGGFFDVFTVEINWRDSDGEGHHLHVVGEQMEELWAHVMGAWPQ